MDQPSRDGGEVGGTAGGMAEQPVSTLRSSTASPVSCVSTALAGQPSHSACLLSHIFGQSFSTWYSSSDPELSSQGPQGRCDQQFLWNACKWCLMAAGHMDDHGSLARPDVASLPGLGSP